MHSHGSVPSYISIDFVPSLLGYTCASLAATAVTSRFVSCEVANGKPMASSLLMQHDRLSQISFQGSCSTLARVANACPLATRHLRPLVIATVIVQAPRFSNLAIGFCKVGNHGFPWAAVLRSAHGLSLRLRNLEAK